MYSLEITGFNLLPCGKKVVAQTLLVDLYLLKNIIWKYYSELKECSFCIKALDWSIEVLIIINSLFRK